MCECSHADPRDAVHEATAALAGIWRALAECAPGAQIPAREFGAALAIVVERLEPAVDALQDYVPRD